MTSIPQQATTGPAAGGHGLGIAAAFGAFATWGISPLYFKAVAEVGAWQLMAHRIVWTQVMLLVLLALTGRLAELRLTLPSRGRLAAYAATTLLVAFNWLMFILAVLQDRLLEASL